MAYSLNPVSELLQLLSSPARIEILLIIGAGETCVCHLEKLLGYRQAYISQHLMALRAGGLLGTRREGKFVFYDLANTEIIPLLYQAAKIANVELPVIQSMSPLEQCSIIQQLTEAEQITPEV